MSHKNQGGVEVREDLVEELERAYPEGAITFYMTNGSLLVTGHQMDKGNFITAMYHFAIALACISNNKELEHEN